MRAALIYQRATSEADNTIAERLSALVDEHWRSMGRVRPALTIKRIDNIDSICDTSAMYTDIGEYIRHLRKKKMLSQEQLASLVGVSQGSISEWERSAVFPSKTRQLADALGVDFEVFARTLATLATMDDPVEQAIMAHSDLPADARNALLKVYQLMRKGLARTAA